MAATEQLQTPACNHTNMLTCSSLSQSEVRMAHNNHVSATTATRTPLHFPYYVSLSHEVGMGCNKHTRS
eukprot:scaffold280282_cov22-Tisochrysis_lutea.AAC.1